MENLTSGENIYQKAEIVKNEKTVIRATVLNNDFISPPHICYFAWIKFNTTTGGFLWKKNLIKYILLKKMII